VHSLVHRVLAHVRRHELLQAGDRVGVAVSGGIDSVALLRLLLEMRGELGIVLCAVHFNHQLRGEESDADEQFVARLARVHGLEFCCDREDVAEHASRESISLEASARELRYGFFRQLLGCEGNSGDRSPVPERNSNQSGVSARPPTDSPQGLTPVFGTPPSGAAEAAAFPGSPTRLSARLDKIVTGHTLDDQAETVLLRLIRGTGVTGLGGIHPRITLEHDDSELRREIVRPLLTTRRRELEQYLNDIGQLWREDSTNSDHAFTRNRLRKLVLPLLEKEFNPAVAENLAELAELARGEQEYWENEVAGWMGTAVHWIEPEWVRQGTAKRLIQISLSGSQLFPSGEADLESWIDRAPWLVANASLSRPWFLSEPVAVQRRVVKAIGEHAGIPLEFKHVEEILRFAAEEEPWGKQLTLASGWRLVRDPEELLFVTPDLREARPPGDYDRELPLPGRATLPEIGIAIESDRVPPDVAAEYNPDQLLDADSLPGPLRVRNWRAGDRFWPAHTKSPKKIKELLEGRHLARPERSLWPVVVSGDQIVWVRGFPTHAKLGAKPGREAVLITEATAD
jgi:tRNA(Ile)-lysidine synthase